MGSTVNRGPLTKQVFSGVPWSDYPVWQEWADEVEDVFSFLKDVGRFDEFRSRLRIREWRGALAEARAGYYLSRIGFSVFPHAPQSTSCPGDWDVESEDKIRLFVEVKGPTWEGELTEEERRRGRKQQPKYQDGVYEARAIDIKGKISNVIDNSLPKFSVGRTNLIVAMDDLFCPLNFIPTFNDEASSLMSEHPQISGIVWVYPHCPINSPVLYSAIATLNEAASSPIPHEIQRRFTSIAVPP